MAKSGSTPNRAVGYYKSLFLYYIANSASCENGTSFQRFFLKLNDLTDWTTGSGLTSILYTAVTDTAHLPLYY